MKRTRWHLIALLLLGGGCNSQEVPSEPMALPVKPAKIICSNAQQELPAKPAESCTPMHSTTLRRYLDPSDPVRMFSALSTTVKQVAGVELPVFDLPRERQLSASFGCLGPLLPGELPWGVPNNVELLWNQDQNLIVRLDDLYQTTIAREVLVGELGRPDILLKIHLLLDGDLTFVAAVGSFGSPYALYCCEADGTILWKSQVMATADHYTGMPYAGLTYHHVTMIPSETHVTLQGHCTDGQYIECFERTSGQAELRWSLGN